MADTEETVEITFPFNDAQLRLFVPQSAALPEWIELFALRIYEPAFGTIRQPARKLVTFNRSITAELARIG